MGLQSDSPRRVGCYCHQQVYLADSIAPMPSSLVSGLVAHIRYAPCIGLGQEMGNRRRLVIGKDEEHAWEMEEGSSSAGSGERRTVVRATQPYFCGDIPDVASPSAMGQGTDVFEIARKERSSYVGFGGGVLCVLGYNRARPAGRVGDVRDARDLEVGVFVCT